MRLVRVSERTPALGARARRAAGRRTCAAKVTAAATFLSWYDQSEWSQGRGGVEAAQPNSGYVFICFDGNDSQATAATQTIQVIILYNFSPVTPLAEVVGASLIQVEASTTMQVQKQQ